MTKPRCAVASGAASALLARTAIDVLVAENRLQLAPKLLDLTDPPASECHLVLLAMTRWDLPAALDLLGRYRAAAPACGVILLGEALRLGDTLRLLAAGASDFITTPFCGDELLARVQRALGDLGAPPAPPTQARHPPMASLIGSDPGFLAQVGRIPAIAGCDSGVLILGETGTGKEICAQAIHYLSPRASRPWVAVNCGAIPTELLENELFGHVRGAYTTAHSARSGLVREAEGGTLFLDEIDCLSYAAQVKMLRFLQDKEYRTVGANAVQHADVRVIAATNHDLPELVRLGRFRQDLYYRLNVLALKLPPLRERRGDIPGLAQHFTREFARRLERRIDGWSPLAMQQLMQHDWPGNIRELRHVIERAVVLARGPLLRPEDLELPGAAAPAAGAGDESFKNAKERVVSSFEKGYVEQLLLAHGGNISQAARAAKKNRRAFFELIRKYGIDAERFRNSA